MSELDAERVLVCGGRDYDQQETLFRVLDELRPDHVILGGASGADLLAKEWARLRNRGCSVYRARWKQEGRSAGPRRNERMLKQGRPTLVVAFPGGSGTSDMVRRSVRCGVVTVRPVIGTDGVKLKRVLG